MAGDVARLSPEPFDYEALEIKDRQYVITRRDNIFKYSRRVLSDLIQIGEWLNEAKTRLPHGDFMPWVEAEFPFSHSTALNYIQVFKTLGPNSQTFGNLPIEISAAIALSSPSIPKGIRDEAIALAKSGTPISHARAKALIADSQKGNPRDQPRPGAAAPSPDPTLGNQGPAGRPPAAPAGADDFPEDEDAGPTANDTAGDEPEFRDLTADTEPDEPDETVAPSERAGAKRKAAEALGQLVRALDTLGLFVVWRPALEQLQAAIRGASE